MRPTAISTFLMVLLAASVQAGTNPPRPGSEQAPPTWTSGQYLYDGSGNVYAIGTTASPNGDGMNTTYTYDATSRLLGVNAQRSTPYAPGVPRTESYVYDVYGNMLGGTRKDGTAINYSVDGGNHLIGAGIQYDPAGNLTAYAGETYSWDATGMMTGKDHDYTWHDLYIYTPDDERIGVRAGDTWTWSFRDAQARVLRQVQSSYTNAAVDWTWTEDYVYSDRALVAAKRPAVQGGDRHFHLDHLGTPRMITNASGVALGQHDYSPYAIELTSAHQEVTAGRDREEPRQFTGHERDVNPPLLSESALDYMHARYYNPAMGRFLSVDTVAGDPEHPQLWNRYAYVANNPLRQVDPTGRCGEDADFVGPRIPCADPRAEQSPPVDVFLFGSLTATTNGPAKVAGEVVGLVGYNSDEGLYAGDIVAGGFEYGGHQNYVGVLAGAETTTVNPAHEDIDLKEVGVGVEIPFVAGVGGGVGKYETKNDYGLFVFGSGGAMGEHGAVGFGFSVKPIFKGVSDFIEQQWFKLENIKYGVH
jgi:RHS repeat-associated protein